MTSLPRTDANSGLIDVQLKRKLEYKKVEREEVLNKAQLVDAVDYLIKNHKSYKNMTKIELIEVKKLDEVSRLDSDDEKMLDLDVSCQSDDEVEDNMYLQTTTLIPENPENNILVNTTSKTIEKKIKKSSNVVHAVAPGEGKILSYWLREDDCDIAAFPRHHPNGMYGLKWDRKIKLSLQEYFTQRLFNVDKRFARDPDYLFIAQYFVERNALEKQIDISYQKGKIVSTNEGTKVIQPNNVFSVFKLIPGTPAYWQSFRNDLFAKIEQLGPFHIFFTLSCGEKRWPEIAASILQSNGHTVTFSASPWDGDSSTIKIDDIPMNEFLEKMPNKSQLFQDEVVLITQMFDNRVKSFINNVFKSSAIKYYTFRIEFQARGNIFAFHYIHTYID